MLRLLIGTGLLLMAVGFGAAGWQYWQGLPAGAVPVASDTAPDAAPAPKAEDASVATAAPAVQTWLISPTGGLVAQADVRAYLDQTRFVPERSAVVVRQARLQDLLAEGEQLPEPAYLEVLADIRAPEVARDLCQALTASIASDCAVNAARVVQDSLDPASGTASFRVELVWRQTAPGDELPDLAAHVLRSDVAVLDLEAGDEAAASAELAMARAVSFAAESCAAEGVDRNCRLMRLWLDWSPDRPARIRAEIGWLDPLPDGVIAAPPLEAVSGD